jgi:hypothetical protein
VDTIIVQLINVVLVGMFEVKIVDVRDREEFFLINAMFVKKESIKAFRTKMIFRKFMRSVKLSLSSWDVDTPELQ